MAGPAKPGAAADTWGALLQGPNLPRLAVLCFGVWLHAACSMLAATTMPSAVVEIGGHRLISWAFSLYQLGSIVAGAATALAVARIGLRRALLAAAVLYGLGSLVAALAPTMPALLGGRLLQGGGGGALVALSYVALHRLFPASLIPRLQALISVVWSTSAFCGPLLGGSFATLGLWRYAFWAFAIQAALFVMLARKVITDTPPRDDATPARLPALRLTLLAAAVVLVSLAGAEPGLLRSVFYALAGSALFGFFLWRDHAAEATRIFPRGTLDPGSALGAGMLMVFTASAATMSFLVYGPFLLNVLHAVDALTAGYIVAMESIGWGVCAVLFAGLPLAADRWLIRAGVATVTLGLAGFAVFMRGGELWLLIVFALCQGAGFGIMWGFVIRRLVAAAAAAERTRAASVIPATQQIGFALGAALCGVVANSVGFAEGVSADAAARVAVWVFAAFLPLALIANLAAWKFTARRAAPA